MKSPHTDKKHTDEEGGIRIEGMSSSASDQSAPRLTPAPRSVTVVNWPLRDGGVRAWLMLILLGAAAAMAGMVVQSGLMGGLCFAALALAAWRLWIPVTFEFRSRGVLYRVLGVSRRIPWTRIVRLEVRRDALLLFGEDDPSQLAVLRSLYIRFNGQRDAIMAVVDYYTRARTAAASTLTYRTDNSSESQ